jgi:hypothetical protein
MGKCGNRPDMDLGMSADLGVGINTNEIREGKQ